MMTKLQTPDSSPRRATLVREILIYRLLTFLSPNAPVDKFAFGFVKLFRSLKGTLQQILACGKETVAMVCGSPTLGKVLPTTSLSI